MNITFLIGNGFDVNYGLKTKYQDFYNWYLEQKTESTIIQNLKDHIKKGRYELWADLECGLGAYSAICANEKDFEEGYLDINNNLRRYILNENAKIQVDDSKIQKIKQYILNPQEYITKDDKQIITEYLDKGHMNHSTYEVNIITFNYTNTLEQLLLWKGEKLAIGETNRGESAFINGIYHLHGSCDDTILLGVNDEEQIENDKFRNNPNITDMLIKPNANKARGEVLYGICYRLISESDLICLFGLSIGLTDKIWWNRIANNVLWPSRKIILFHKDNQRDISHKEFLLGRIGRELKDKFITNAGLSSIDDERKKIIQKNIHIGFNTNMFNL